ncbi:MAG: hypothetical protein D6725_09025 [Planctomycetota bacterium]|nr:MAG: hypothetical protein D6725_09025 [Planctomycetota bacterium]
MNATSVWKRRGSAVVLVVLGFLRPALADHAVDLHVATSALCEDAAQLCWDVRRAAGPSPHFKRLYREAHEIYQIAGAAKRVHHSPAALRPKLKHLCRELHEFRELVERARLEALAPHVPTAAPYCGTSLWLAERQRNLTWQVIAQRVDRMHAMVEALLCALDRRPAVPRQITATPPHPIAPTLTVPPVRPAQPPHADPVQHAHHGDADPGLTVRPHGRRIVIGDGRHFLFSFSLD